MKLLSTILILLIFSLIVNPNACSKAADSIKDSTMSCCKSSCEDNANETTSSEDDKNDINKCDNPFMSCSHISFTTKTPLDLTYSMEINTVENNFYIQPVIQNSNNSIWRPPKLV